MNGTVNRNGFATNAMIEKYCNGTSIRLLETIMAEFPTRMDAFKYFVNAHYLIVKLRESRSDLLETLKYDAFFGEDHIPVIEHLLRSPVPSMMIYSLCESMKFSVFVSFYKTSEIKNGSAGMSDRIQMVDRKTLKLVYILNGEEVVFCEGPGVYRDSLLGFEGKLTFYKHSSSGATIGKAIVDTFHCEAGYLLAHGACEFVLFPSPNYRMTAKFEYGYLVTEKYYFNNAEIHENVGRNRIIPADCFDKFEGHDNFLKIL